MKHLLLGIQADKPGRNVQRIKYLKHIQANEIKAFHWQNSEEGTIPRVQKKRHSR